MKQSLIKKFNFAIQLEKNGDYPSALKEYISIIKQDRGFRKAYINLGSLYSRMNDLPRAMRCYKEALKVGHDYLTYFNIGSIYYKTGKYKKAVINLEKSRKHNNNFALSTLVMGLCYSRLNNIKAAESNFNIVLKIMPGNRVALIALAIMYYNQNRYNESINLLDIIIKLDDSNIKIRELKSNILYKSGRLDETAEEIKSLKKISNGYKYYDEFIKSVPVEVYTDRYGTLDEKIESLSEKAEDDKNSLITLSLCHLFKGETDTAIDYLFKAKKKFSN